jgi:hypothetical protein
MTENWCVLEFETGRHTAIPNSLGRLGVPCIVPMVTESKNIPGRKGPIEVYRPALYRRLFMAADEHSVRMVLDKVRYAEKVWRRSDGALMVIPDASVQMFMDGLEKREKKPKAIRKVMNLGDLADKAAFDMFHRLFGLSEAIKRMGVDLSDREAA